MLFWRSRSRSRRTLTECWHTGLRTNPEFCSWTGVTAILAPAWWASTSPQHRSSDWSRQPPPDPRPLLQSVDRLHPDSAHQRHLSRPALQLPLWSDSFFPGLALLPPNPLAWQQPGHLPINSGLAQRPLGMDPAVLVSGEGMAIEREGDELDTADGEAGGEGVEEAEGGKVVDGDLGSGGGVEEERGGVDHDGDGGGTNYLEGGDA